MAKRAKRRSKGLPRRKRIVRLPEEYFDALDLSNVIFPALYQFENGLRLAIHGWLETCYGATWWDVSLQAKRKDIFDYAYDHQRKLNAMPWIGASSMVKVLPIHLITLGQLEEIVKTYRSDCIPQIFPSLEFFVGHMELIKRVRNMYSHMFPCITRGDCQVAKSEIRILSRHINSKL
jgi:hypothetical protein